MAADLTATDASEEVLAQVQQALGPVDILMANAGLYLAGDVAEADPGAIDQVLATNVVAVFQAVRAVLPGMIARGGGDILVTSSVAGHQAIPWEPVYSASKHAVQSFVHGLRQQVGPQNVRVLAIAPGVVDGEHWDGVDALFDKYENRPLGEKKRLVGAEVPFGRMGTADDLTGMAIFLASQESNYVVAQTYNVDGGNWMS